MSKDESKTSATVSNAARAMAQKRWAQVPPAERKRLMTEWGKLGGRPKESKRCFCGKLTMARAASRSFDCCRAAGVLQVKSQHKPEEQLTGT